MKSQFQNGDVVIGKGTRSEYVIINFIPPNTYECTRRRDNKVQKIFSYNLILKEKQEVDKSNFKVGDIVQGKLTGDEYKIDEKIKENFYGCQRLKDNQFFNINSSSLILKKRPLLPY